MEHKEIAELAQQIYEKEKAAAELTKSVKEMKERIKQAIKEKGMMEYLAGDYTVILKDVPVTRIADTDAMKAAGIFDEYSKPKAGYTSVSVKAIPPVERKGE